MADLDIGGPFVDKRKTQNSSGKQGTVGGANYRDVPSMRARLTAINPTYYTTARLNALTVNDMVSAIRQADDAGSI